MKRYGYLLVEVSKMRDQDLHMQVQIYHINLRGTVSYTIINGASASLFN